METMRSEITKSEYNTMNYLFEVVEKNAPLLLSIKKLNAYKNTHAMALIVYNQCGGYKRVVNCFLSEVLDMDLTNPATGRPHQFAHIVADIRTSLEEVTTILKHDGVGDATFFYRLEKKYQKSERLVDAISLYIQHELGRVLYYLK